MTDDMHHIGKFLIIFGMIIIVIGSVLLFWGKIPFAGRLPGDIMVQKKNFTFYFPVATSIVLSLLLTLLFWVFGKK
jgi:hypothetical protein